MNFVTTTRRRCFIEEDDGHASLADFSRNYDNHNHSHNHPPLISRPFYYTSLQRIRSNMGMSSSRSTGFGRYYDARFEEPQPHFLEFCFLCKKSLGHDRDIFMYRGDIPFCSEECRQEQIEIDEAKEKSWNISTSMKGLRRIDHRKSTTSPNKTTHDYTLREGTFAAA